MAEVVQEDVSPILTLPRLEDHEDLAHLSGLRPAAAQALGKDEAFSCLHRDLAAFFLDHALSRTQRRNAILVLVGVFERTVVILPDSGIRDRIAEADLQEVIARMTPQLAAGRIAPALRDGLDALEALLIARGCSGGGRDEIAQEVIEEKGA